MKCVMALSKIKENIKSQISNRDSQIEALVDILGGDVLPPGVFIYGHTSTGKSLVLQRCLESLDSVDHATIHCVECLSCRFLYESVLSQLGVEQSCDNANDFVHFLKSVCKGKRLCIVLDKTERLRDLNDGTTLQMLHSIAEFSGLDICIVSVSEIPFEKFRCGTGGLEPLRVFFPQYMKDEMQDLLLRECPEDADPLLYKTYLSMILGVFLFACRDLCELRYIASQHWNSFMDPITNKEIESNQTVKLWRHLEPKLRLSLNQVYLRGSDSSNLGLKMELPYLSKFLLIAAYLASYNPAKYDRRLFVKAKEGRGKRKGFKSLKNQKLHNAARLMGPNIFPIDRLMAIFYSIVEQRVTPSINLFVQISTLVSLKLLVQTSITAMLQSIPKYRCNASYELVKNIARTVNFELSRYLYDTTI